MANYTKLTNFATKDSLASGNPLKVIKGTEIDDEFEALETAIATKIEAASPALTGTPTAPTAAAATDSTQIATTAFVKDVVTSGGYVATAGIADDAVTQAKIADDSVGADQLVDTAVTAGTYGSSTAIPSVTVDAQGRITAASETSLGGLIGVGQSWSSPSRSIGTTYTNSTGSPILVNIGFNCADYSGIDAYVDGVQVWTHNIAQYTASTSCSFIVPNGSTYNVAHSGGGSYSLDFWAELS